MTMNDAHVNTPDVNPHRAGVKHDEGKARAGLMARDFANALTEIAEVTTYGCRKYAPGGWLTVPDGLERYTDAMHRHLLLEHTEGFLDQESRLPHAAHAAWNALARLELMLRDEALQTQKVAVASLDDVEGSYRVVPRGTGGMKPAEG